jgi:thiamine-phosphate pyrophosphorylase
MAIGTMKVCYVTNRKELAAAVAEQTRLLLEKMESAANGGVDWIQIREKDLSGRELAALTAEALRRVPRSCRILVNDRLDVALACGAGGAHLGESSLPVAEAKRLAREKVSGADFLVGASVHSLESAQAATQAGADYLIFGPVYETPSKLALGLPQGVERLGAICRGVSIPVLAIGGVTRQNAQDCVQAGASGIAAIRLLQGAENAEQLVRELRDRRFEQD